MTDTQISHLSPADQFRAAIAEKGISPPDTIEGDGKIHRFSSSGKPNDDAGWYVFHDGDVPAGAFGDFRTGRNLPSWVADIGRTLSPVEKTEFKKKQEEIRVNRDAETAEHRAKAKKKAANMLKFSRPAPEGHPYLVRKGVKSHGLRIWKEHLLLVPMYDDAGEIQSLQIISEDGEKKFLSGGRMQGCHYTIGDVKNADIILVAEGYATAATIYEITGHPVVVAYNAGNLLAVSSVIRAQHPYAKIFLCADDDHKTKDNPGITKATEAAQVIGGNVIVPVFGNNRPDDATDFNDMSAHLGKEAVTSFFINRFLERRDDPMTYSTRKDAENEKAAILNRPATPYLKQAKDVITGTVVDCGVAPYRHDKKNGKSFFVKVRNGDTERTLWGIDLENAMTSSGVHINDDAAIHDLGKAPVQVVTNIRDKEGKIVRQETRTVMKGMWRVEPLEEFVEAQMQMTPLTAPRNTVRSYQAIPSHAEPLPDPIATPKLHFSNIEFEAIHKVWKNVPRKVAHHSEDGYHIVFDDKRKIAITRNRIELAKKPRHRPNEAYRAACEHARLFWNGQMEIQGDAQHRIKAWAYATAYDIQITNFTPTDRELVEAEKILASLRKDMEPAFRRPSGKKQATRQSAKMEA